MRTVYLVTSALPGPGAAALVKEKADELSQRGYIVPDLVVEELTKAAAGACEFVELEDADGHGLGNSIGTAWLPHPTSPGLHRLGPLAPAGVLLDADGDEVERRMADYPHVTREELVVLMHGAYGVLPGESGVPLSVVEDRRQKASALADRLLKLESDSYAVTGGDDAR